jgi:hypothetical protein
MGRRTRRVIAGMLGALSLAVLTCAQAAPAGAVPASAPAWHVDYQRTGTVINQIAATGPRNAWAIGDSYRAGQAGLLLHWNGSSWRTMSYPGERTTAPAAIFALSATDFWLFVSSSSPVLHWRSGHWSTLALPVNAVPMAVLSDSDIWVAGGESSPSACPPPDHDACSLTSHWNGTSWTTYPLPATEIDGASASSPSSVWAVGENSLRHKPVRGGFEVSFVPAVYRWTGTAWQRTSLAGRRTFQTPTVIAYSARDVYVGEATTAHPGACAMHWTGARWSPFYLPASSYLPGASHACGWIGSDFRGGLWFSGPSPLPYFTFVHWSGGRFTSTPHFTPDKNGWNTDGFTLAAVPHSKSDWLYGSWCLPTRKCVTKGLIAALR